MHYRWVGLNRIQTLILKVKQFDYNKTVKIGHNGSKLICLLSKKQAKKEFLYQNIPI